MKKNLLFLPLIALLSTTFVSCGDVIAAGELPNGGREIENTKAVMKLASTLTSVDTIDNLGLSFKSNLELTFNGKTEETGVVSEHLKINNLEAEVKVNGLTTATNFSELKASATLGFDYDIKIEDKELVQKGAKASAYLADGNAYFDISKLGEDILSLIEVPEEIGYRFYGKIADVEGLAFPLLKEDTFEGLMSDVEIDYNSFNELAPILTAKDYGDKTAIAFVLTEETLGKYIEGVYMEEIENQKVTNPEFDYEAALKQVPELVNESKEEFSKSINYMRATIVFDDECIKELSYAIDAYLVNDKVSEDYYQVTRLVADFEFRFLVGNEAKINLPSFDDYKKIAE